MHIQASHNVKGGPGAEAHIFLSRPTPQNIALYCPFSYSVLNGAWLNKHVGYTVEDLTEYN